MPQLPAAVADSRRRLASPHTGQRQARRQPGREPAGDQAAKPAGSQSAKPAGPKPAAKQAAKPAAQPARGSSSSGIGVGDDLRPRELSDSALSEVGLHQQALNTRPCPGCTAPLAPDAVICIKCGFNTKLGRRMETMKVGSAEAARPVMVRLLKKCWQRAADTMEEDAAEERRKTGEGVPWWAYLLGILAAGGFMVTMMVLEQSTAVAMAAVVMMVVAWLVGLYAGVRVLMEAFRESFAHGMLHFGAWLRVLLHGDALEKVGTFVIIQFAAGTVVGLAFGALKFAAMLKGEPGQSSRPEFDRPVWVAVSTEPPPIVARLRHA